MATLGPWVHAPVTPGPAFPATVTIRFRVLREGEVSAGFKKVLMYKSFADILAAQPFMCFPVGPGYGAGDGEYSSYYTFPAQLFTDNPSMFMLGFDDAAPKVVRADYLSIAAAGTYLFNIAPIGTGAAGSDATVAATVEVEDVPSAREVVVLEREPTGAWRIAGSGTSLGDGSLTVPLKVLDPASKYFAIGADDFGTEFTPNLVVPVGYRVRPTTYAGYLYEVTTAGTLPATEPEWWRIEGDNVPRLTGTAWLKAVRYFQPIGHGPFPVTPA